ncbi:ElaB/YqjD/DUF883 family membrane-anchored ribosome-binding protein [Actinoplanes octamycinicus]|uniref:ElaB/YqjD/DUF883 family membrane-anchored ribosome-binding protein n=1 Tax=Actinoplanes octamycinicus TaxID=135948 RepID=A0A7W7M657_9ACTN|nr:hypothetical protein [Actinoplanes octamycinicus]MBB4738512.1 ElaB/YqjD/DUF883 family membrane-anchored ribosome-binding protein [Actinoplanes octamycinicus]GIE57633.1 hypothetical protein Aoc01nite_30350 [Actinoplanes octamycinicus]
MDRLDHLLAATESLLSRVDEVLATVGAPAGHDVWPELRRVRLLPGDAVRAVAALHPAAVAEAVPELRAQARACAATADALPLATDWSGAAAESYEAARRRTAEQLNAGPDSLSRRMTATADLADAVADWMTRTRHALATCLAGVLTSAPALTVGPAHLGAATETSTQSGLPTPDESRAAADIAARLLATIASAYDQAEDLLTEAAPLKSPQPA